ncbi:MAG: hypothetical protein U9P14_06280 [Gemmatimonadota bacterium]|nr:hypothetical protein [Gemmatimonadota bacterium]
MQNHWKITSDLDWFPEGVLEPGLVKIPSEQELEEFLDSTIISFSGWRRIFAADGDEESKTGQISPLSALFSGAAAAGFARWLAGRLGRESVTVAVAADTRPTGPAIASCMTRALLAARAQVRYLAVAPTPEALAYAASEPGVDGLILVTASHNPLGHNGLKFSTGDGGVLPAGDCAEVEKTCLEIFRNPEALRELAAGMAAVTGQALEETASRTLKNKQASLEAYTRDVNCAVAAGGGPEVSGAILRELKSCLELRPLGVVAELNGSARTCSIDEDYLGALGLEVCVLGDEPGRIGHAILPEGEALEPACRALEKAAGRDASFELGYVPDMDGDRGNVVILVSQGKARSLEAQEVFALSVAAQLSFVAVRGLVSYGPDRSPPDPPLAVVVNGPTSGRIERIAGCFGARVFRAETGEANLIELAQIKRDQGYLVPILGEGSNGGNITYPGKVRDPLNTVLGLIKLVRLEGVLDILRSRLECLGAGWGKMLSEENPSLEQISRALPVYCSTGSYEKRAVIGIQSKDHDALKAEYEKIFRNRWAGLSPGLESRLGITGYRFVYYEGVREIRGEQEPGSAGRGGFKVLLEDKGGRQAAFLWMRGSRTEPVFRVMADAASSASDERYLLDIHREIIEEADKLNK